MVQAMPGRSRNRSAHRQARSLDLADGKLVLRGFQSLAEKHTGPAALALRSLRPSAPGGFLWPWRLRVPQFKLARTTARSLAALVLVLLIAPLHPARAQTPSPLQEWQYLRWHHSGQAIRARSSHVRVIVGLASEVQPVYDGSRAYRIPVLRPDFLFYYRDIAFISSGEGIGYNFLRGDHYQFGLGVTYDLGRKAKDDLTNLHGMGDIDAAPVGKLYGSVVLSRKFPLILRVDARQFVGGAQGAVADAAVYTPLPGSSKNFVMFAGPSITLATHHYLQTLYGVDREQALASGHPEYLITHNGTASAGVGFSATKFLGPHWLINIDGAIRQLRGDPAFSPIVERRTERAITISFDWQHEAR